MATTLQPALSVVSLSGAVAPAAVSLVGRCGVASTVALRPGWVVVGSTLRVITCGLLVGSLSGSCGQMMLLSVSPTTGRSTTRCPLNVVRSKRYSANQR